MNDLNIGRKKYRQYYMQHTSYKLSFVSIESKLKYANIHNKKLSLLNISKRFSHSLNIHQNVLLLISYERLHLLDKTMTKSRLALSRTETVVLMFSINRISSKYVTGKLG